MGGAADTRSAVDWDGALTFALTVGVCVLGLGTVYVASLLRVLRAARTRDPAEAEIEPGWLLVPGKRLVDGRPDSDFAARLHRAAGLAARPPGGGILILGGVTGAAGIGEAEAGLRFLRALPGGDGLSILCESQSQDTLANLRNARGLLASRAPGAPVTLISNRYHLARIGLIAESLGIAHRLCPAESQPDWGWGRWPRLLGEAFYCLWFEVGRGWARLTRNRRMLARVT